ncbi:MBL fold metallo-hydrolase [Georgenia sp. MJ170]|uniref:MBL fold metallo-hydrolase n=1 Tax=Georgenia sunbinii TaxID=3117728 RepID=UPI002F262C35
MTSDGGPPDPTTSTTPWRGGPAGRHASSVLAPNPGPMTLEGTNTWVLRGPGATDAAVVDPGPAGVPGHLAAARDVAGGEVALTLLTHHHLDHTGAVPAWTALTGSPARGAGHGAPWRDGERIAVAGVVVEVLVTPGHTADSVCFLLDDGVLLTGDTVLGRGTTVVPWPDGDLGAYLASLDRLVDLARAGRVVSLAPAHGPVVDEPLRHLTTLRDHRQQRLAQVRAAVAAGARGAEEVRAAVYGDLAAELSRAADMSVRAQLAYLGEPLD